MSNGRFIKGDPRIRKKGDPATGGSFTGGYDPRREGKRTKISIVDEMQKRASPALKTIDYILNAPKADKDISPALRFKAAQFVIERGFGKTQSAEVLALNEIDQDTITNMSLPELLQFIQQRQLAVDS